MSSSGGGVKGGSPGWRGWGRRHVMAHFWRHCKKKTGLTGFVGFLRVQHVTSGEVPRETIKEIKFAQILIRLKSAEGSLWRKQSGERSAAWTLQ